jgi:cell wall-associated NlpC family hydrolase
MPIKKLTLSVALCVAAVSPAFAGNHTVANGDTLLDIAKRYGVPARDILRANDLSNIHQLKLGQVLVIPRQRSVALQTTSKKNSTTVGNATYVVRNGDHDWNIAAKVGLTPTQLRTLNPQLNWRRLQIGQKINVGRSAASLVAKAPAKSEVKQPAASAAVYTVRSGDNDWVIARQLGTTPSKLHAANPGVYWTGLKPGHTLRVPAAVPGTRIAAAPVSAKAAPRIRSRYARINADRVSVRRGPTTDANKLMAVAAGVRGTVVDREGQWLKLKFPHGTAGWVREDLLAPVSSLGIRPVSSVVAKAPAKPKVSTKRSAVVARATAKPTRVASAPKKSSRFGRKSSGGGGIVGKPVAGGSLLAKAESFRGVRYSYGAMSRSATDCSGFTSQVFRSVGVKLPRTSREQARVGAKVDKNGMAEGDLVFFRTTRGNRISHVGIYVGNGKFMHASSGKGRVRTDSLSSSYYAKRFVTARRVVSKKAVSKTAAKPKAPVEKFPDKVPALEPAASPATSTPSDK